MGLLAWTLVRGKTEKRNLVEIDLKRLKYRPTRKVNPTSLGDLDLEAITNQGNPLLDKENLGKDQG